MNTHKHKVRIALMAALGSMTALVNAAEVSITGGFTEFSSSIAPPNTVPTHTYVNQTEIFPAADGTPFQVPINNFGPVQFVESDFLGQNLQTANFIQFTPGAPANVSVGQEFKLGTFTVQNGVWFGDADIAFSIRTLSLDPALSGFTFTDSLHMHLNPFVPGNPALGADFFYFTGNPQLGSIRVYELFGSPNGSNELTIDFYGKISSLDPTRFANPQGGGFLSTSVDTDPALTVPDGGSSAALLLIGLGTLKLAARRLRF